MIFSKEDFDSLTPLHGSVVIKVDNVVSDNVKLSTGLELGIVSISDKAIADSAVRRGTVVKVPKNNVSRAMNYHFSSPIEIEVGDTVMWSRYAISRSLIDQATGEKKDVTMQVDGETYITIIYPELVLCQRDGVLFGLNDYIVAETIPDVPTTFLIIPESAKKAFKKNQYKVIATPKWTATYTAQGMTQHVVEQGDTVLTTNNAELLIEDKYHRTLPGEYVAFQSRMVCGVMEETI